RAERLCREKGPVVELLPFLPLITFVVATERLKPRARDLFRAAVTAKLGWYGAELLAVREVARTGDAVAAAYQEAIDSGADLVLFAGASAIDPLDPAYAELTHAGGDLLQLVAPMHPGSMLWLGRLLQAAVVAWEIRLQVIRSAAPLVDGAPPVVARVVQTAGSHLDQALVETTVRTLTVVRPFALPGFVRVPVAAAVKKLDALPEHVAHGNNRFVDEARTEYSRVNLSSDPIYRYLRIT